VLEDDSQARETLVERLECGEEGLFKGGACRGKRLENLAVNVQD
jgi:hypothetical protein